MTWKTWLALLAGVIIGFTFAATVQELLEAKKKSWAMRNAANCVSISRALEHYRVEHGVYPPLSGGVEHLREYLTPKYLSQVPTLDASGQPFLVVLNGPRAVVISVGPYGAAAQSGNLIRGGGAKFTSSTDRL